MLKSIRAELKLIGILSLIIVLAILGWITLMVYESQDNNIQSVIIEQNNIDIQKLPINARIHYQNNNNQDSTTFRKLQDNVNDIEEAIQIIQEGGIYQQEYKVNAITGKEVQQQINAFNREFRVHKGQLTKLITNNISESQSGNALIKLRSNATLALNFLSDNNEQLIIINNRIQRAANKYVEAERNRTRLILFIIILSVISLCVVGILIFKIEYIDTLNKVVESTVSEITTSKEVDIDSADALENIQVVMEEVIEGMKDATTFAYKIGEGDFDYQLKTSIKDKQLGQALVEMRDKLLSFSDEERKQTWFNNGIAEVSNLLSSNSLDDLEEVSIDFLKFIIKYINLNQGAIFIRNEENSNLFDMKACYAFDKKKFVSTHVEYGQGLIGQAIAEGSTTYEEQVPKNYVHITSGLGTAPPTVLLIVPIKDDQTIFGAAEFASFNTISSYEIELIEEACKRFAGILTNLQVSINTQKLLNETQRVNQELQVKEEQMKANALKLGDTQKTLNDKLTELENETNLSRNIVDAINKTSATVEFDLNGNILEVNDMYLSIMGYTRDNLLDTNEKLLVPDEDIDTTRYDLLWDSLRNGSFISGEYKRVNRFGKEIWLNGTYNPIFDLDGKPYKIIQIAQFTTEEKEKDLDYTSKINAISGSFPLIDLDIEGKVLSGNATFSKYIGLKRKEFRNRSFSTFLPLDEIKRFHQIWEGVIHGNVASHVLKLETKDKEEKFSLVNLNPIYNLSGKIYKVLVFLIDITDQKQLEISLLKNKEDLSHTVSELEVVQQHLNNQKQELEVRMRMLDQSAFIFELDLNLEFIAVNKLLCAQLATTRTQLIHKPFKQVIHPELGYKNIDEAFVNLNQKLVERLKTPFISFEGTVWWGDITIAKVISNKGKVLRYIGIVFDITQQINKENSLRESLMMEKAKNAMLEKQTGSQEEALGLILEQLSLDDNGSNLNTDKVVNNQLLPTVLLDNKGTISFMNALAKSVFIKATGKDSIAGDILHWINIENVQSDELLQLLEDGILMERELTIHKDQDHHLYKGVFIPIFSNDKSKSKTLLIITEKS